MNETSSVFSEFYVNQSTNPSLSDEERAAYKKAAEQCKEEECKKN